MDISILNLTKYYGEFCAVDSVSFSFSSGKLTAIVGRNGSGKTTTIRSVLGLVPKDGGEITVNGNRMGLDLKHVGYLAEERGLFPKETVFSQLMFFARLKGMTVKNAGRALDYWLERLEIPQYKKNTLESLSKGNQQKVQIIASLIHDPEIIIFDEPFSGLDPVNMQMVIKLLGELRAEGKCILVSSHQLPLIEQVCEDICIIDHAKSIYWGSLDNLKSRYGENYVRFSVTGGVLPDNFDAENVAPNRYKVKIGTAVNPDFQTFLRKAVDAGISFETLEQSQKTLQEIFLELAGEEQTDA